VLCSTRIRETKNHKFLKKWSCLKAKRRELHDHRKPEWANLLPSSSRLGTILSMYAWDVFSMLENLMNLDILSKSMWFQFFRSLVE
jgi:hypothetical protein